MFINNLINHWHSPHRGSLRDYFIPHQGNGYRPHSLHPKRILFHATSLIVVKAIVIVFAVVFPLSAWMTPDLALQQSKKIIAITNTLRKSLNLPVLTENQKLNQAAFAKAQDMLFKEYFAHISPEGRGLDYFLSQVSYRYAVAGENLAIGFATPEEVIVAWKNSPTHYANLIDPDFTQIGVGMSEGKYQGTDTTLVAQYFGASADSAYALAAQPKSITRIASAEKKSIVPTKKVVAAVISPEKTKVVVQTTPDKKEQAVQVETYLATTTKTAEAVLGDTRVSLQKDPDLSQKWTGAAVVKIDASDQGGVTKAPVAIAATNESGDVVVSDVNNINIQPRQIGLIEQYFFFKNDPNRSLELIFDISSLYFKFILLLAVISLLLNIFIEIKKQHPHLIASGVGLTLLLLIFITF
jgi:uncharacterized protein YkwD